MKSKPSRSLMPMALRVSTCRVGDWAAFMTDPAAALELSAHARAHTHTYTHTHFLSLSHTHTHTTHPPSSPSLCAGSQAPTSAASPACTPAPCTAGSTCLHVHVGMHIRACACLRVCVCVLLRVYELCNAACASVRQPTLTRPSAARAPRPLPAGRLADGRDHKRVHAVLGVEHLWVRARVRSRAEVDACL